MADVAARRRFTRARSRHFVIARNTGAPSAYDNPVAMKQHARIDRLEETMENPDLPPIALAPVSKGHAPPRAARRALRRSLVVGGLLLAGAFVALGFVAF